MASGPLLDRGPEALQEVLAGRQEAAEVQLRLLNRAELRQLCTAAKILSVSAERIICTVWPDDSD